jgi:hypothetical protein
VVNEPWYPSGIFIFSNFLETHALGRGEVGVAKPSVWVGRRAAHYYYSSRELCHNVHGKKRAVSRYKQLSHSIWHRQYHNNMGAEIAIPGVAGVGEGVGYRGGQCDMRVYGL